jgi:hypothetical protein
MDGNLSLPLINSAAIRELESASNYEKTIKFRYQKKSNLEITYGNQLLEMQILTTNIGTLILSFTKETKLTT